MSQPHPILLRSGVRAGGRRRGHQGQRQGRAEARAAREAQGVQCHLVSGETSMIDKYKTIRIDKVMALLPRWDFKLLRTPAGILHCHRTCKGERDV